MYTFSFSLVIVHSSSTTIVHWIQLITMLREIELVLFYTTSHKTWPIIFRNLSCLQTCPMPNIITWWAVFTWSVGMRVLAAVLIFAPFLLYTYSFKSKNLQVVFHVKVLHRLKCYTVYCFWKLRGIPAKSICLLKPGHENNSRQDTSTSIPGP